MSLEAVAASGCLTGEDGQCVGPCWAWPPPFCWPPPQRRGAPTTAVRPPRTEAAAKRAGPARRRSASSCRTRRRSQRWKVDDPKYLKAAFDAAGVPVDMQNAQGDKARFTTLADQMISDGVKVLMIVNLDSPTGTAVLDKARAPGIKTIDYDRLTLGGGADYYVSFDNVKVGELQGKGLIDCLAAQRRQSGHRGAERLAHRQQRHAVQDRATTRCCSRSTTRPRTSRARTSAVPDWNNARGRRDLRADAAASGRRSGACSPPTTASRNAVDRGPEERRAERQGAGHRPGRHRRGPAQHPHRGPVHDRLQGDQAGGAGRGEPGGRRCTTARSPRRRPSARTDQPSSRTRRSGAYVPFVGLTPQLITKGNIQHVIDDGFADAK